MNLFIAVIAAMSLLCYSPNAELFHTPLPIQFETLEIDGGGIVDVVGTLTSVDVHLTSDTPGLVEIKIFNNSGMMVAEQNLIIVKNGTVKFPKNILEVGILDIIVDFPKGRERVTFEIR